VPNVTGVPIAPVLGPFGRNQLFSRDTRGHLDPSEGAKVDLESMSDTVNGNNPSPYNTAHEPPIVVGFTIKAGIKISDLFFRS
jgi:hypothetical protein